MRISSSVYRLVKGGGVTPADPAVPPKTKAPPSTTIGATHVERLTS